MKRLALASLSLSVMFGATHAHASGYLVARFGADHGSAAAGNGFSVYYNPAAMGATPKTTSLTLDAAPVLRFASYTRTNEALGDRTLADPNNNSPEAVRYRDANTGTAHLANVIALGYFSVVSDLGTKSPFRVGYAAYIPFGGQASWEKHDRFAGDPLTSGAIDGPQRWHNIEGRTLSIYNTIAASYTFEKPRVSLGVNASVAYHTVHTIRARNIPANDDGLQLGNGAYSEGRTILEASGVNASVAAGVYWEPVKEKLKLGFSWTSQPGIAGAMRLHGKVIAQSGTNPGVNAAEDIDFLQTYPNILRLGMNWKVSPKVELRADAEYVLWSSFKNQCVVKPGSACDVDEATGKEISGGDIVLNLPRNWNNTIGGRIGVGYFFNDDKSEVFGSFGGNNSAVPKANVDPVALDAHRISLTAGARHTFNSHFSLAGSLNMFHFFTVNTNGSSNTDQLQNPSKSPSADGKYTQEVVWLNLNGTYAF